jgi:molybdopterin synthase catalytic subunit
MQVRVLFFGVLKDVAGRGSDVLELRDGATLGDVVQHYESQSSTLCKWLGSVALSVNQEYAHVETTLHAGDEVGFLPPVSGGREDAGFEALRSEHATLTRDRIDTEKILRELEQPEDGAAVVFEGIVRNNTRGRRTLFLNYEAYEQMALKQIEELARQALAQHPVRDIRVAHRVGRLEIGEASVVIVVASAHRGPAFEACRWLIDTLKKTVPIWKKEHFADGAMWADGEPFPEEIPRVEGSPSGRAASK